MHVKNRISDYSILLETFRFYDENDYEYKISLLKFFRVLTNYRHPGKIHCSSFSPKNSTDVLTEGASAISPTAK